MVDFLFVMVGAGRKYGFMANAIGTPAIQPDLIQ